MDNENIKSEVTSPNMTLKEKRRLEATLARRHVYTTVPRMKSLFEEMTDEEREEFFAKEKKRSVKVLKHRKIRHNVLTGIGLFIAGIAAFLALVPIFFTFLNSFMSSEEIIKNATKQALKLLEDMKADRESFRKIRKIYKPGSVNTVCLSHGNIHTDFSSNLILVEFNKKNSLVLENYDEILKELYGDYMKPKTNGEISLSENYHFFESI